jgi:4-hydroxy-2-oxoheptanedioate aldolase
MTVRSVAMAAVVFVAVVAVGPQPAVQAQGARPNRLIEQYKAGQPAIVHTDWAWINMENSWDPERLRKVLGEVKAEREKGSLAVPVVRVPSGGSAGSAAFVQIALSLGLSNIVIPKITSAEEARRLVKAMRYPPQSGAKSPEPRGERTAAADQAAAYWGVSQDAYRKKADLWPLNPDGELVAIAMIESKESVANIDEILRVPGLGGVLVGPYDLGDSLGVGPPKGGKIPEATEAEIQKVRKACQAYKKIICGLAGADISQKDVRIKEGWNMIQFLAPGVRTVR